MSINLIIGCMFSGKTTALINIAKRNKLINRKVLIINYSGDTRYSDSTFITTHDNISLACEKCDKDITLIYNTNRWLESEVICVNEGQFFENLLIFCTMAASLGKEVHVCGLSGDFFKRPFGEILNIIPHCESVTHLNAVCMVCKNGTPACFTKKMSNVNGNVIEIGSIDIYTPVCRKCYNY